MTGERIALSSVQELHVRHHASDLLEVESVWQPGPPPPRHAHPRQQEVFEVLEGELTVEVGSDAARVLTVGDTLVIPPRTPHRMWNTGTGRARASWQVTPALRTLELFRFISRGTGLLRGLRMLWTYRQEFRVSR